MRQNFQSLVLLTVSLWAQSALSLVELDKAIIKDEPLLAHFSASLSQPRGVSVRQLLDARHMKFIKAPDPSNLMFVMNFQNHAKSLSNTTQLTVLSYNVALLDVQIFEIISVLKSPYLKERREQLPNLIFRNDYDVILLQELWRDSLPGFVKTALTFGYDAFYPTTRAYDDGLVIFAKRRLLENTKHNLRFRVFEEQDPIENFPGPLVKRGFLHLELQTAELGTIHIYNTHLQSFRKHWRKRNYQARQLGLDIRAHITHDQLAFVGGDINASPYFKDDIWRKPNGTHSKAWWKNSIAYAALLYYGGLSDGMVMGLPPGLANIDVEQANRADHGLSYCDDAGPTSFTATDCNSLNMMQYAGKEPPSRQDHILLKDPSQRTQIIEREIRFRNKMDFGVGKLIEPSDHFGVLITALVQRTR